jgi:hypothetical protein
MEHLPFELLDRILKSACTDNGQTGCALSAVSHHVRDASAYMRYHSVALRNPKQICAFVIMLNDQSRDVKDVQSSGPRSSLVSGRPF